MRVLRARRDSRAESDSMTRARPHGEPAAGKLSSVQRTRYHEPRCSSSTRMSTSLWALLGARRATLGRWRVSPNARPRSSPWSVETSSYPSGSPCASQPSSGARADPRAPPVVSRMSLPDVPSVEVDPPSSRSPASQDRMAVQVLRSRGIRHLPLPRVPPHRVDVLHGQAGAPPSPTPPTRARSPRASRSRFSNAPSAPGRPPTDPLASSRSRHSPPRAPTFSLPRRRSCAT